MPQLSQGSFQKELVVPVLSISIICVWLAIRSIVLKIVFLYVSCNTTHTYFPFKGKNINWFALSLTCLFFIFYLAIKNVKFERFLLAWKFWFHVPGLFFFFFLFPILYGLVCFFSFWFPILFRFFFHLFVKNYIHNLFDWSLM